MIVTLDLPLHWLIVIEELLNVERDRLNRRISDMRDPSCPGNVHDPVIIECYETEVNVLSHAVKALENVIDPETDEILNDIADEYLRDPGDDLDESDLPPY